jgi:hypothetical protein
MQVLYLFSNTYIDRLTPIEDYIGYELKHLPGKGWQQLKNLRSKRLFVNVAVNDDFALTSTEIMVYFNRFIKK